MICDSPLAESFWEHGRSDDCPVIDVHGHMGPFVGIYLPRSSTEAMIHTMDQCGVRMLLFSHHASMGCPDIGNAPSIEAVRKYPDRLRAYLTVNPHYPEHWARDLAAFDDNPDVFVGLKLHADSHQTPLDAPSYEKAWEFADQRSLPVLAHTWGYSECSGAKIVRKILAEYRSLKLLLGHSLHGDWSEAVAIAAAAREYENVQLVVIPVEKDLAKVAVKFTDLKGPAGTISKDNLQWRIAEDVRTKPSYGYPRGKHGWKPDPILPGEPFGVKVGRSKAVWVTAFAPPGAKGGDYAGTITVAPAGAAPVSIALKLRVWDYALPLRGRFRHLCQFQPQSRARGRGV